MTIPLPITTLAPQDYDGLVHIWCCQPFLGACGARLRGVDFPDDEPITCPVCRLTYEEDLPCGFCEADTSE